MRRSWIWWLVGGVSIVAAVLVLITIGGSKPTSTTLGPSTTVDKYDFVKISEDDFPLSDLSQAKFASMTVVDASVTVSHMVKSNQISFKNLAQAIAAGGEVDTTVSATRCTLTFVFDDRRYVTFDVDAAAGLIAREGKVWRPKGDLEALLDAVTVSGE